MSTIKTRPDGLYISTHTTWPQLATDETLRGFANGLIPLALNGHQESWTLAELLHHSGPQSYPLLTTLLVLDAEVNAVVEDKQPVFPLPGFLTYRARLSPDKFPLSTVRLPTHNRNGHYLLSIANDGFCAAVCLDLHPELRIVGHIRLAISSPTRLPVRLQATEHRLERQPLNKELIQTAIAVGSKDLLRPLTTAEQTQVAELLQGFIGD